MKTLMLALCALSLNASAQTFGISPTYDYDAATSNRSGLKSVEKTGVYIGSRTSYGQFEAGLYEVEIRGERFRDSLQGTEVGYSNGFNTGPVYLSGRVAVGQVRGRGLDAPSDKASYKTFLVGAGVPITKTVAATISARFRPGGDLDQQQQYSVGVAYSPSKHLTIAPVIRHTRSAYGPILNGAAVQVLYLF